MDWNTQRVVDGNEPESGGTIKRDGKMLVTGKLTNPSLEAKLMIWQSLPPMMSVMSYEIRCETIWGMRSNSSNSIISLRRNKTNRIAGMLEGP